MDGPFIVYFNGFQDVQTESKKKTITEVLKLMKRSEAYFKFQELKTGQEFSAKFEGDNRAVLTNLQNGDILVYERDMSFKRVKEEDRKTSPKKTEYKSPKSRFWEEEARKMANLDK